MPEDPLMNYDQSNPTMVPNQLNPIISEEQVFDDYREDPMMDPSMDSRPGHQDYYESEYGSIQSPNPSSFSQPKTQPSHATNASVKESKIDSPNIIDDSEKSMTPKAMAAFQQHQDIENASLVANTKRFPNDKILSRHDSSSSIPCSSDMISVKNIEDREDEYSKMKMALLSEITENSNNGSTSPYIAAITSPSLAHDLMPSREKEENQSSVYRDNKKLGPRTRSKDNLESIFGGVSGQTDNLNKSSNNPPSVVHNKLPQDRKSISVASHSNVLENESRLDNGMMSSLHNSRSNIIHSPVKSASNSSSRSEMLSSKNPPTNNNNRSNRSHHINHVNQDDRDYNRDTSLNNSQYTPKNDKITNDAKNSSSQFQVYNPANEVTNSYEYSAIPPVNTSDLRELANYVDKSKHINRQHKPHGVIMEETYPLDISPESCPRASDLRTSKAKVKSEPVASISHEDKKGTTSNVSNVSSSATGDFYTIPEVPEEEEASSPPRIGGVAKRRTAGRC